MTVVKSGPKTSGERIANHNQERFCIRGFLNWASYNRYPIERSGVTNSVSPKKP